MKLPILSITPPSPIQNLIQAVNVIMNGGSNSIGKVTLTNGGTTTTLYDNNITATSVLFFFPQTAHAASVTGFWYDPTSIVLQANAQGGSITLNHSAVAQSDLTFGYEVRN